MSRIGLIVGAISIILGYVLMFFIGSAHLI